MSKCVLISVWQTSLFCLFIASLQSFIFAIFPNLRDFSLQLFIQTSRPHMFCICFTEAAQSPKLKKFDNGNRINEK